MTLSLDLSREKALEPSAPLTQEQARTDHVAHQRQLKGWRTVKDLVEELRFPSDDACREFLRRHHIPSVRRGRVILVSGLDVDAALRGTRKSA
jgi:hypothetical protein